MSKTRRPGVIAALRAFWAGVQTDRAEANRRLRQRRRHRSIFDDLVEKMTNHERSIWAKAGYPGLRQKDVKRLMPYAQAAQRRIARGVGRPVR